MRELCDARFRDKCTILHVTVEGIYTVGALLKAGGYRSPTNFLGLLNTCMSSTGMVGCKCMRACRKAVRSVTREWALSVNQRLLSNLLSAR